MTIDKILIHTLSDFATHQNGKRYRSETKQAIKEEIIKLKQPIIGDHGVIQNWVVYVKDIEKLFE